MCGGARGGVDVRGSFRESLAQKIPYPCLARLELFLSGCGRSGSGCGDACAAQRAETARHPAASRPGSQAAGAGPKARPQGRGPEGAVEEAGQGGQEGAAGAAASRPGRQAVAQVRRTGGGVRVLPRAAQHKCAGHNDVRSLAKVRPVLAGQSFSRLADVKDQVRQCRAIAAVNANYFKKDGTPLGTLMIDREWVAGPLYDRVSLGITRSGFVRIDRVDLYGTLRTSNLAVPSLWVNNINQPRRHGSHLVLYTRRWGNQVRMAYAGCLIAVDASGKVVEKTTTVAGVPPGGYVLSDSKGSPVSRLRKGDYVNLSWHTRPASWADVEQAVSGGPMLIKDGQLYVDLKAERFRKAWTGRQIHARTAAGVTADNHLLLVTIEGSHTLWDFAKFMLKLGAVDAMNLDGGGSTTMVVGGATVTRNARTYQRRVASSLAVVESATAESRPGREGSNYVPSTDLSDFAVPAGWLPGIYPGGSPEMMPLEEAHGAGGEPGWLGKVAEPGNIISQAGQPDRVP